MRFKDPHTVSAAIIGAGRVGSALTIALAKTGIKISSIVGSSIHSAKKCAVPVNCRHYSTRISEIVPNTNAIFITTPDSALMDIAGQLSTLDFDFSAIFIAHTSGLHTSEVLEPLRLRGAQTASFHPIQTFAGDDKDWQKFNNIYIGIEGTSRALEICKLFAQYLSANHIIIPKDLKPLYHAACVFSSNYIVALLSVPIQLLKQLNQGDSIQYLLPLVNGAIENIKKTGIPKALTGPIARGDVATITEHLKILQQTAPESATMYSTLGRQALRLAREGKQIDEPVFAQIEKILK